MNVYQEKAAYMALPKKYRKAGDMPTQWEIQDALDAYRLDTQRKA